MSAKPKFDDAALRAVWGARSPATFDRAGRVRLLGEFAKAVLADRKPSRESMLFVAGAIQGWLARGGSLERDYLKVSARAGSHNTPATLWALEERKAAAASSR